MKSDDFKREMLKVKKEMVNIEQLLLSNVNKALNIYLIKACSMQCRTLIATSICSMQALRNI